jgi:MFS family permease
VCIFEVRVSVNNTKHIWDKYALGLGILFIVVFTLFSALAATCGGAGLFIGVRFLEGIGERSIFPAMKSRKNKT